jgi:putative DNA-invertase from lambdoid prophage Rac
LSALNPRGKNGQARIAIYTRVSTQDQDCQRQISDLTDYAAKCNYQVTQIFTEIGSGAKNDRLERKKVIQLARSRSIDIILVSELTRWGRSTIDLIESLNLLKCWDVSLVAQNGFQFDLSTPHGKMIASIMATLAEFERDLLRERIKSGIANARSKGKVFGRPKGGKIADSCDRAKALSENGKSYRQIATEIGISKTSVGKCLKCREEPEGMKW